MIKITWPISFDSMGRTIEQLGSAVDSRFAMKGLADVWSFCRIYYNYKMPVSTSLESWDLMERYIIDISRDISAIFCVITVH
jgi:hypothetical protein